MTLSIKEELKPCPWCGIEPSIKADHKYIVIKCWNCQYSRSFSLYKCDIVAICTTPEKDRAIQEDYFHEHAFDVAVKIWNTRESENSEWIAIKDKLPPLMKLVALVDVNRFQAIPRDIDVPYSKMGYLDNIGGAKYWACGDDEAKILDSFTHWMRIPIPKSLLGVR